MCREGQGTHDTLSQLEKMKQNGVDKNFVDGAIEKARKDLEEAHLKLAAATLGVPETDIVFIAKYADRKAGKINITEQDNPKSFGRTGSVGGAKLEGFQPGQDSAFEIDLADLVADPIGSQVTLFHEVSHLARHGLRSTRTRGILVKDPPQAFSYFKNWIDSQKDLTQAEKELIVNAVQGNAATTEALANVQSFLAALRAGPLDQAKKELVKYATALLPGKLPGSANPPTGSAVLAAQQGTKDEANKRKAEKKPMSDLWISSLKFSR
jgi:hypothetical protein